MRNFLKPWMMWLIIGTVLVVLIPLNIIIARRQQRYEGPHQVMVRRIVIHVDASKPDGNVLARSKVEELLKRVRAGESFAELAGKYSELPGDKENQGLLDWRGVSDFHPSVAEVAFSLKEGEVSDIITFSDSYGIIKVEAKRP